MVTVCTACRAVVVPPRLRGEGIVGSSLQFELSAALFDQSACDRVIDQLNKHGKLRAQLSTGYRSGIQGYKGKGPARVSEKGASSSSFYELVAELCSLKRTGVMQRERSMLVFSHQAVTGTDQNAVVCSDCLAPHPTHAHV